jgi:hypothetical protein
MQRRASMSTALEAQWLAHAGTLAKAASLLVGAPAGSAHAVSEEAP